MGVLPVQRRITFSRRCTRSLASIRRSGSRRSRSCLADGVSARANCSGLIAGSWVYGNFSTWIGHAGQEPRVGAVVRGEARLRSGGGGGRADRRGAARGRAPTGRLRGLGLVLVVRRRQSRRVGARASTRCIDATSRICTASWKRKRPRRSVSRSRRSRDARSRRRHEAQCMSSLDSAPCRRAAASDLAPAEREHARRARRERAPFRRSHRRQRLQRLADVAGRARSMLTARPYFSRSVHAGNVGADRSGRAVAARLDSRRGAPHAREAPAHFRKRKLLEALIGFENQRRSRHAAGLRVLPGGCIGSWLIDDGLFLAAEGASIRAVPWWQWQAELRDRERQRARGRARAACGRDRAIRVRAVSLPSSVAGAARACACSAGSCCSATSRSTSRTTASRSGRIAEISGWMRRASRSRSRACRRITSRPTARSGAIRSTTGQRMQRDGFAWWMHAIRDAARALRPAAHRSFPRPRVLLGNARRARDRARRRMAARAGRGAARTHCVSSLARAAVRRRGPGRDHAGSRALRDRFDLPGMRILQFAFDGSPDQSVPAAQPHARTASCTPVRTTTTRRAGWYALARCEHAPAASHDYCGCRADHAVPRR